jgi:hypothetical protein
MTAVDSTARVDVGALAATIKNDAYQRVGSAVTSLMQELDDDGRELNELQRTAVFENLLSAFDGFERSTAKELVDTLKTDGVEVWGLSNALGDLSEEQR